MSSAIINKYWVLDYLYVKSEQVGLFKYGISDSFLFKLAVVSLASNVRNNFISFKVVQVMKSNNMLCFQKKKCMSFEYLNLPSSFSFHKFLSKSFILKWVWNICTLFYLYDKIFVIRIEVEGHKTLHITSFSFSSLFLQKCQEKHLNYCNTRKNFGSS